MNNVAGWEAYFQDVSVLLEEGERQYGIANRSYTDYMLERLELSLSSCSELIHHLRLHRELEDYLSLLKELVDLLKLIHKRWEEYGEVLDSYPIIQGLSYQVPTRRHGRGRPQFEITKDQLEYLSSLGFKWNEIAALLGVSRMTIFRRRVEYGLLNDPVHEISDEDLSSLIQEIRQNTPFSGSSMMYGSLRSRGIKVTRERIRSTLRSVDPLGSALRWPAGVTKRRPYSVAGPNSLWHIDSHHKLIRWRLVTHGGIDGYSRLITFLQCSSNNRSTTVFEQFLSGVQKYMLPSRVRSDQGTENILVARYMIEKRGAERRSMITGCSVHNQRIERLWRDMHRSVTVLFYKLFYFLEHHGLLDHLNEHHLWALHYIYIPRINKGLKEFVDSWNNHPTRTAGHKSPQQLYTAGLLLLRSSQLPALDFLQSADDEYGIDLEGPIPSEEGSISVPESTLHFSDRDVSALRQNIDPCAVSENYAIDFYQATLTFISTLTPVPNSDV